MIVKVTQEHIDKAWENITKAGKDLNEDTPYSCNCPVAAALKDTFKVLYARAGYKNLRIGKFPEDPLTFITMTPLFVAEWMCKWDLQGCHVVEPFEFELSLEGVKL